MNEGVPTGDGVLVVKKGGGTDEGTGRVFIVTGEGVLGKERWRGVIGEGCELSSDIRFVEKKNYF
jgi:hypothetical protein